MPRAAARVVRLATLAGVALLVAGCARTAVTEQGRSVDSLYGLILIPAAIIFVLVEGLIIWSVIRYRRRDDELPVQTEGNRNLEIIWTVIPALVVLGVFLLSEQTLGTVDAKSANPAVIVDVSGHQWFWNFHYEKEDVDVSGVGQRPELVLPTDRSIRFNLTSADVIHSFYMPAFLFKRDVIPGVTNSFELTIKDPGTYSGQCAEFCGLGHADMKYAIRAVSGDEYATWVQQQQAAASSPSPGASAAPSGSAEAPAATLEVSASTPTSFEQSSLTAPADKPFAIHFTNKEAGVPHNVAVRDSGGTLIAKTDIVTGPAEASVTVSALKAGSYTFFCMVHPNMQGTLTVQ
jgi:cytochrome c oxidase subunit 2